MEITIENVRHYFEDNFLPYNESLLKRVAKQANEYREMYGDSESVEDLIGLAHEIVTGRP